MSCWALNFHKNVKISFENFRITNHLIKYDAARIRINMAKELRWKTFAGLTVKIGTSWTITVLGVDFSVLYRQLQVV